MTIDIEKLKRGKRVYHIRKNSFWVISHVDFANKVCYLYQELDGEVIKSRSCFHMLRFTKPTAKAKAKDPLLSGKHSLNMVVEFNKVMSFLRIISENGTMSNKQLYELYCEKMGVRTVQRITLSLACAGYLVRRDGQYSVADQHKAWLKQINKGDENALQA